VVLSGAEPLGLSEVANLRCVTSLGTFGVLGQASMEVLLRNSWLLCP
jgi:hypothetical protein